MAAIERLEKLNGGIDTNPIIASGRDNRELELLAEAHALHGYTTVGELKRREELEEQIAVLQSELDGLRAKPKHRREESRRKSEIRANRLRKRLQDPSSTYHGIYRAILLNAEEAGGSLAHLQTHNEADRFGREQANFSHYLENSVYPQPVVRVRNIPTADNKAANMQFDFGLTRPGSPLDLATDGEVIVWKSSLDKAIVPQLWGHIPMLEGSPMHALRQSPNNSHFVAESEAVTKVLEGGIRVPDSLSMGDIVPVVETMRFKLPMGNLYTSESTEPYIIHDNLNGEIERIALPGNYQEIPRDELIVVGKNALRETVKIIPIQLEGILDDEKIEVVKAMIDTMSVELEI